MPTAEEIEREWYESPRPSTFRNPSPPVRKLLSEMVQRVRRVREEKE
jgi:hypothetical protein